MNFIINELKLDIDEVDVDGKNALAHVYEEYKKDEMLFLIEKGADIDLPCMGGGKTILLDSCYKGYKDLFEFLLK